MNSLVNSEQFTLLKFENPTIPSKVRRVSSRVIKVSRVRRVRIVSRVRRVRMVSSVSKVSIVSRVRMVYREI